MNQLKLFLKLLFIFCLLVITTASYSQLPQRIISLAPSLTSNLYLLHHEDHLIGCTNYCLEAKEDGIEIVASAIKANIEKIISLQPDIILATSLTDITTREILEKAGQNIHWFPLPKSFEEINSQFIEIGELIGKQDLAVKIVNQQLHRKDSLIDLVPEHQKLKVFVEIGTKPLFCVIPNTFLDDYIKFSGASNIAHDLTYGQVSRESILIRDPDVIMLVTMGNIGLEEKQNWHNYPHLSAVKKDNIFIVDSNVACSPTPTNFIKTLETFITHIYNLDK